MCRISCHNVIVLYLLAACVLLAGCAASGRSGDSPEDAGADACRAALLYKDVLDENYMGDSRKILAMLAQDGLAAIDDAGECSFVNPDVIHGFFAEKDAGGTPSVRFYRVCYDGGLICTTLYYADGWRCQNTRAAWRNGMPEVTFTADYALTALSLTEKGSLIYTCDIPDNTAASKHDGYIEPTTIIRLTPKDPACVEAEDKYLAGIGYNYNGLFTCTWTTECPDSVCLNDLYLSLWRLEHGDYIYYFNDPYPQMDGTAFSLVPGAEFEALIMKYLDVPREYIRAHAQYDAEADAYPVYVQGPHDGVSDSMPSPEVTAVQRNADGTYTLTVDAVYPAYATDCAFTHVVTVRPEPDGAFRYMSNTLLPSPDNILPPYTSRIVRTVVTVTGKAVELSDKHNLERPFALSLIMC